jgi:uncharacterized protein
MNDPCITRVGGQGRYTDPLADCPLLRLRFRRLGVNMPVCYNKIMEVEEITQNLPGILLNFPEISLVYLFGSQVTGQVGPMSDYDLAVLVDPEVEEPAIQTQFQHAVTIALQTDRVDIVLLRRAPVELAYHIIAEGKLLYQREKLIRVEYEARVLGMYGDYLPFLRSQRDQILQGDADGKRVQRYRAALRRTQRTLSPTGTPKG